MMQRFVADLHVHSLLSPCAEVEMTPRNIIWHATSNGIDIVAITDHNSCDNVRAALEAAEGTSVTVLPGMEVESKEEAHFIVLFDKMRQLVAWEQTVAAHMSGRLNDANRFGAQLVVDAEDNFIRYKEEMLLTSLTLSAQDVAEQVNALGGICIASHVDRNVYSILSQLGFIPPDIPLAALEISRRMTRQDFTARMPSLARWPLVTSSDAHTIEDFISGPKTIFLLEQPTVSEIRQALAGLDSREVVI
jgi:3',5'-nucleoside bisphosphate phosphatase